MSKNAEQLNSFMKYCGDHPEQRFWQAIRNWSGAGFILWAEHYSTSLGSYSNLTDTFYWSENKK
jgi:hypothetical protein